MISPIRAAALRYLVHVAPNANKAGWEARAASWRVVHRDDIAEVRNRLPEGWQSHGWLWQSEELR